MSASAPSPPSLELLLSLPEGLLFRVLDDFLCWREIVALDTALASSRHSSFHATVRSLLASPRAFQMRSFNTSRFRNPTQVLQAMNFFLSRNVKLSRVTIWTSSIDISSLHALLLFFGSPSLCTTLHTLRIMIDRRSLLEASLQLLLAVQRVRELTVDIDPLQVSLSAAEAPAVSSVLSALARSAALSSLESLSLSGLEHLTDEDLLSLVSACAESSSSEAPLRSLSLSLCPSVTLAGVLRVIASCRSLSSLTLHCIDDMDCDLSEMQNKEEIFAALRAHQSLSFLTLDGPGCGRGLALCLAANVSSLRSLSMSHCETLSLRDLLAIVRRQSAMRVLHLERVHAISFAAWSETAERGDIGSENEREARALRWQWVKDENTNFNGFLSSTDILLRVIATCCPSLTVLCLSPSSASLSSAFVASVTHSQSEESLTDALLHLLSSSRFPSPADSRLSLRMLFANCRALRALTLDNSIPFSDSVVREIVSGMDDLDEGSDTDTASEPITGDIDCCSKKRKRTPTATVMPSTCILQSLRLRGNIFLTSASLREIVLALRGTLREVDVSQCPLVSDDVVQILRKDCPEVCVMKW